MAVHCTDHPCYRGNGGGRDTYIISNNGGFRPKPLDHWIDPKKGYYRSVDKSKDFEFVLKRPKVSKAILQKDVRQHPHRHAREQLRAMGIWSPGARSNNQGAETKIKAYCQMTTTERLYPYSGTNQRVARGYYAQRRVQSARQDLFDMGGANSNTARRRKPRKIRHPSSARSKMGGARNTNFRKYPVVLGNPMVCNQTFSAPATSYGNYV